jgi:polyhydroxyalkanoate synthase
LAEEAIARARRFVAGVKTYRHHPAHRSLPEAPVIWQDGTTLLRDYNPRHPDLPPVLVIPSLVNRFEILDLDMDNSFLRTLAAAGFRPLLVDWNEPGAEEKGFSLSDYVTQRLIPMLDLAAAGKIHILGYCMGGLLALALALLKSEKVRTLTLMATPWDFHKPDPAIGPSFLAFTEQMEPSLKANGELPADTIQSLFAVFQPMQVVTKFTAAAALDPASAEARHFVLLEDWLNEGVPLAAPVARETLYGWYGENVTAKLEWKIAGKLIDPREIGVPTYVLAPGKDRIVPPESALPLAKLIRYATLHEPMMGHIGLIASQKAPAQVWTPLFKWLDGHK